MISWLLSYLKRGAIGVALAAVCLFTFGETPLGLFLILIAVSFAGFFGTAFSLLTPLGDVLRAPLSPVIALPFLAVWLTIDLLHFIFVTPKLQRFLRWVQGWLGILTLGMGFIVVELIKVIPFVLKVVVFLWFGYYVFGF